MNLSIIVLLVCDDLWKHGYANSIRSDMQCQIAPALLGQNALNCHAELTCTFVGLLVEVGTHAERVQDLASPALKPISVSSEHLVCCLVDYPAVQLQFRKLRSKEEAS